MNGATTVYYRSGQIVRSQKKKKNIVTFIYSRKGYRRAHGRKSEEKKWKSKIKIIFGEVMGIISNKELSFGRLYDSGLSKEDIMRKLSMKSNEYDRVLKSLLEIRVRAK